MSEQITYLSKILSEMNDKVSSMVHIISEQGADLSRLPRIIKLKDKEIHVLKRRLSKYEVPNKDSHNSSILPFGESILAQVVHRTQSLCKKTDHKNGGQFGHPGPTLYTIVSPDIVKDHRSLYCEYYGISLEGSEFVCTGTSQVIDIPLPRPRVKEYRSFDVICSCGHVNQRLLPEECNMVRAFSLLWLF